MAKQQVPFQQLKDYLPENSFEDVYIYLRQYKVQLTITRQRQTVLGDYRHAHQNKGHRISINGNLNPFSFLVTLLHELAHLFTFEKYGSRIPPHGKEWKDEFGKILASFVQKKIFPPDIESVLLKTLKNPAASSCGDESLLRALRNYDIKKEGQLIIEQLRHEEIFKINDGRLFKRAEKIRTRYKCIEIQTGKTYLFSGLYEVQSVKENPSPY